MTLQPLAKKDQLVVTDYQGNFSAAGLQLKLQRNVAPYVAQYFLPSALIVLVKAIPLFAPILQRNNAKLYPNPR